jgi:hypothetical protein
MPCTITESWLAVEWWVWEGNVVAPRGTAGAGFYNPIDNTNTNRWRRRVRYHLHVTGTRENGKVILDTGRRLLHEIVDLPPGLEPAPTALPPQFALVTDDCAPIQENPDDRYYCLPRVQRVVTTLQRQSEPSLGFPTSGAFGGLGVAGWTILPLPASAVADIARMDHVFVKGGPPSED